MLQSRAVQALDQRFFRAGAKNCLYTRRSSPDPTLIDAIVDDGPRICTAGLDEAKTAGAVAKGKIMTDLRSDSGNGVAAMLVVTLHTPIGASQG